MAPADRHLPSKPILPAPQDQVVAAPRVHVMPGAAIQLLEQILVLFKEPGCGEKLAGTDEDVLWMQRNGVGSNLLMGI